MTATTSKLGADTMDGLLCKLWALALDTTESEFKQKAPALLARQPAAIDKDADDDIEEAREILENMVRSIELDGNYSTEATCTFLRQALNCLPVAAPLANEASKPAPSVEQDARGAFEAWARKQPKHVIKDLQRYPDNHPDKSRAGQYGHCTTADAWGIWQAARAASTSANVAQGWKLVPVEPTDEMKKAGTQCAECAVPANAVFAYRAMLAAAPIAPSANVAQGAEQPVYAYVYEYDTAFGLHRQFEPGTYNGSNPKRTVKVYAAPPAQTALTDDARDAARYRWLRDFNVRSKDAADIKPPCEHVHASIYSHAVGTIPAVRLAYGEELDRSIDAALTAAQSASGDKA